MCQTPRYFNHARVNVPTQTVFCSASSCLPGSGRLARRPSSSWTSDLPPFPSGAPSPIPHPPHSPTKHHRRCRPFQRCQLSGNLEMRPQCPRCHPSELQDRCVLVPDHPATQVAPPLSHQTAPSSRVVWIVGGRRPVSAMVLLHTAAPTLIAAAPHNAPRRRFVQPSPPLISSPSIPGLSPLVMGGPSEAPSPATSRPPPHTRFRRSVCGGGRKGGGLLSEPVFQSSYRHRPNRPQLSSGVPPDGGRSRPENKVTDYKCISTYSFS